MKDNLTSEDTWIPSLMGVSFQTQLATLNEALFNAKEAPFR